MKITEGMVEAGCRAMHEAQGSEDADAPLHSPYQNSWDEPDSVRWRQWDETVREVLAAALAAAEQPVAIKPLEWQVGEDGYTSRKWDYRITENGGKWGISPIDWPAFDYPYITLDEAKAAAQQDFEARIRSALASPVLPAPSQDTGDNGRLSLVTQKETAT